MANGQANLLSPISPKTTKRSAIDHRQTMTTIPWPFCWILFLFLLNEVHSSAPWLLKIPRGGHEANPFEILEDRVVYSRWRVLTQRKVRMRNGKVVDFDLVGVKTGGGAVLVFSWDTKSKTATLIREYMPACNRILWGMAAGLIEEKHDGGDPKVAAQHELEEECHLTGGKWIPLTHNPSAMDKYATTKMNAFLVLDAEPAKNPKPLDEEEDIEIVNGVTIPEILEWIAAGEMNLVSGWGCMLAIEKLRELGEYP